MLAVADTGVGIPAADLERIFKRFFRTAIATRHAVQGSGLGLTITKAIVEAHHGAIAVESDEGRGSTFTVRLPLLPMPAPDAAEPAGRQRHGVTIVRRSPRISRPAAAMQLGEP